MRHLGYLGMAEGGPSDSQCHPVGWVDRDLGLGLDFGSLKRLTGETKVSFRMENAEMAIECLFV